jgi:hypothetical protein
MANFNEYEAEKEEAIEEADKMEEAIEEANNDFEMLFYTMRPAEEVKIELKEPKKYTETEAAIIILYNFAMNINDYTCDYLRYMSPPERQTLAEVIIKGVNALKEVESLKSINSSLYKGFEKDRRKIEKLKKQIKELKAGGGSSPKDEKAEI